MGEINQRKGERIMFTQAITSREFGQASMLPACLVNGEFPDGDASFMLTLSALLLERGKVTGNKEYSYEISVQVFESEEGMGFPSFEQGCGYHAIEIIMFDGNGKSNKFIPNLTEIMSIPERWERLEIITEFCRRDFDAACFVSREFDSAVVAMSSLKLEHLHLIEACIPRMLPWVFNTENEKLTDTSEDLVRLLANRHSEIARYRALVKGILDKHFPNVYEGFLTQTLSGIQSKIIDKRIVTANQALSVTQKEIEEHMHQIQELVAKRNDCIALLSGYESMKGGGETEKALIQYFKTSKNVELMNAPKGGNVLKFRCSGNITYFDEDAMEVIIKNDESYFYRNVAESNKQRLQILARAIFVERKMKLRVCAAFRFDIDRLEVDTEHLTSDILPDCIPNQHLMNYGCMGGNTQIMQELIRENLDIIAIIEQCLASTLNYNAFDTTVMAAVGRDLVGTYYKRECIEYECEIITPREAILRLCEEEK